MIKMHLLLTASLSLLSLPLQVATARTHSTRQALPVVDLGYERHRAIELNTTGDYYNFTNIRFGQPPVGDLRWAAPKPPASRQNQSASLPIVDGSAQGGNCPQAFPCWFEVQTAFVEAYLAGQAFDFASASDEVYGGGACSEATPSSQRAPWETEDCLFLDVFVPTSAFEKASVHPDANSSSSAAPVLVYFYGGGYAGGAKNSFGNFNGSPAGLIHSSRATSPDGLIYVAINYRLGSLGWMFGSDFASQGGLVNAGLYDQRLALQWVQDNIHLFGGDPDRVTVMGESAGGGSIIMQMTAFGNKDNKSAPFHQAITQSAALIPSASAGLQNQVFAQMLDLLNVSSLEAARQLPSQQVIDANHIMLASAPYGSVFLGPVVDDAILPDDPRRLLRDGKVDKNVKVLTSIASNEGLSFASANITNDADFDEFVGVFLEGADDELRRHVASTLYPPVFDGSLGYTNQLERARLFWAELVSTCNAQLLHDAVAQPGYANLFDVWPAMHQGDIPYVFYNGPQSLSSVNGTVARSIQDYITSFVITGNATAEKAPALPDWDPAAILGMSSTGFAIVNDPTDNDRCSYWHDAPF